MAAGYRHCVLVTDLPLGGALLLEHTGTELRLTQAEATAHQVVLRYLETGAALHAYLVPRRKARGEARLRPPMTCVEVVKAALGIDAPFILTPLQLARHLVRQGARDVAVRIPAFTTT